MNSFYSRIFPLALLFALLTSTITPAQLPDPRTMVTPPLEFVAPQVDTFSLGNGTRIVFLENHELPVVQVSAMFHGGSAYENESTVGLAEITASLLRSGGAGKWTGDQIDDELDFLAATITSAAESDRLTLSMRCLRKDFGRVLEMYGAILTAPRFDTERLKLEVSNKRDEIQRQNDSPQDICRRVFYETLYGNHSYGLYPTVISVGAVTDKSCRIQYRNYYRPDNVYLAISGDVTRTDLVAALEKILGMWRPDPSAAPIEAPANAAQVGIPGVYYAFKDVNQTTMRLGHLGCEFNSPDRHAVRVMNYTLGVGFTSRLTAEVRSKAGLAYSVGSYFLSRPLTGPFFSYCQTKSESTAQALKMIIDIIGDVRDNGITAEEFARSKDAILNSFVFEYETPQQIVESAASDLFYGFPLNQTTLDLESLKRVSLADCNAVAKKYLDPSRFVIVAVGDSSKMDKPLSTFGAVKTLSLDAE